MSIKLAMSALAVLFILSCATQEARDGFSFDNATLFGMVYDENNQPCAGARITVDGQAGPLTDIRGRFVMPSLSRGDHDVVAHKEGYEALSARFSFLNRGDVIYLRMVSFDQLLTRVENALDDRRWDEAEAILQRAAKLSAGDTVMLYLKAIQAYKKDRFGDAAAGLQAILENGSREPHVYLFLADLYEHSLGNPAMAVQYVEAYLDRRADADVEKRLAMLKEKVRQLQKDEQEAEGRAQ
jgi:hypothetical protein